MTRGAFCRRSRVSLGGLTCALALALYFVWPVFVSRAQADDPAANRPASPAANSNAADVYPRETLPDAAGGQLDLAKARGNQATVFVALSTECPISKGYIPTLNRLADAYKQRGVSFVALNPNSGQSLRQMANLVQEYKLRFPLVKDASGHAATQLGLTICPQVCLVDAKGQVCYRGRIDDRYMSRNGSARDVAAADLQKALDELLAGKPITERETKAIGCPAQIASRKTNKPAAGSDAAVTYTKQISRIVQTNCQDCHRPSGIGPFSLMNYDEAVSWADDLRQFTANGTMPPWKPVDGFVDFRGHRGLTAEEKDQIAQWVKAGCPEGRPEDSPEPRKFVEGWQLGVPDLVLEPAKDFHLDADGADVYRCFVLPTHFDHDEHVVALEVLPGNPKIVHHVIAYLDTSGRAQQLADQSGPEPGFNSPSGSPGFVPVGGIGGWAPGNVVEPLTGGMARTLPAGAAVVMQVHYHKDGKAEIDRTRLGLHFAKGKVTRAVRAIPVMPRGGRASGMKIPADDKNYEVACSLTLPRDALAVGISPHMHLLGKDMRVTATLPDGSVLPMLWLKDWDFNWQQMYRYREPLDLPSGTRIDMVAHFDNSASNPRNPHRPPQTVTWGEQTTDEMCIAFVEMAPKAEAKSDEDLKVPSQAAIMAYMLREKLMVHPATDKAAAEKSPGVLQRFTDRVRAALAPEKPDVNK